MASPLPSTTYPDEKTTVVAADVTDVQASCSGTSSSSSTQEKWQPGFRKRFPWFGCATLTLAVCMTIASVIVLITSNKKATSQWPQNIAPNVVLSILNSAASICFALAVAQGIAIAWWRRALRGASIEDLHSTWSFGDSSLSLVKHIKNFNLAAVAAMATKIAIVDGILFQRSTGTYVALGPAYPSQLNTFPSKHLPNLAYLNDYGNDTKTLWYWFTYDVYYWQQSANGHVSYIDGFECEGVCTFKLSAPGYVATCTSEDNFVDFYAAAESQVLGTENATTSSTYHTIFEASFNITLPTAAKNYTWIGVNTTSYMPLDLDMDNTTQRCPATLTKHSCEFRQAMINYPIYVQFTNVSTKFPGRSISKTDVGFGVQNTTDGTLEDLGDFNYDTGLIPGFLFENWIENTTMTRPNKDKATADGGIFRAMADRYTSIGTFEFLSSTASFDQSNPTNASNPYTSWSFSSEGSYAGFAWLPDEALNTKYDCPIYLTDPLKDLALSINTLAFTTAQDIYTRPGFDDTNEFWSENTFITDVMQAKSEPHYVTRFPWMYGAIASTLCCVLLILPAYWGFWELGRNVTLNPLEVANAFQAPVLAQASVNAKTGTANDVVRVARDRRVVYTEEVDGEAGRRYIIVPR